MCVKQDRSRLERILRGEGDTMTNPYQHPQDPIPVQHLPQIPSTPASPTPPYPPAAYPYPSTHPPYYPAPPYGATPYPYGYLQPPVQVNVYAPHKSAGIAVLLAFLFGAFGLLYATVSGGLILLAVNFVIFLLGFISGGLAFILWFFTWIGGMVWAYTAVEAHNRQMRPPGY